jgi:hypothetical protein
MKRPGNVLPFPSDNPSGASLKLFAVIFYLFLAGMLTFGLGLSESGLSVLVIVGVLYNLFIRHRLHKGSYFRENAPLLIILLVIFLLAFQGSMMLLLILAAIYWLLVGKSGREAPYFLKFHLVTALIVNFFLLMPFLLFKGSLGLIYSILKLAKLGSLVTPVITIIGPISGYVFLELFWAMALWLSISVLMGRTPYIPVVTDNARHWS